MKENKTVNKYDNYASFSEIELKEAVKELKELINSDNAILKARWSYQTYKKSQYEMNWGSVTGAGLASIITTFATILIGASIHDLLYFNKVWDTNLVSLCGISGGLAITNLIYLLIKIHKIHKNAKEDTAKVADVALLEDKTSDMVILNRIHDNQTRLNTLKKELKKRSELKYEPARSFQLW